MSNPLPSPEQAAERVFITNPDPWMEQVVKPIVTTYAKGQLSRTEPIDIVFDGPPSMPSPSFVEVENNKGESIGVGEWIERDDGYWVLRIDAAIGSP